MAASNFQDSLTADGRYRLLVEAISDYAIYMLDPDGVVTNWNLGAERFKGYQALEIIGQNFSVFYTQEDRANGKPLRNLQRAAEEGRFEEEGWRLRKDGSRFWANVVIDRILDPNGRLAGFAKITRDLTERRERQAELDRAREALLQAQKMEAIGQLTGGVAHDFNNLLMAVLGSLEIVQKRMQPDPKVLPFLDNAVKAAQRGANLTQRMLAFARRQELQVTAIDVAALVRGMTDMLERALGPSYYLATRFPSGLPPALTDGAQLENAILNLVVNARDASPNGGCISVFAAARHSVAGELAAGTYVVVGVTDEGEGMDEQTLAQASVPFFTTKGVGKGTGLGLSMVHGLAKQSGGALQLISERGKGTTAEIWLPIASGASAGVVQSDEIDTAADVFHPKRILAVDDDPLVLMNTTAMLEELGHEVFEAYSGQDALEILKTQPIDILVTDQGMPKMTGAELAKAARINNPSLSIILATGYAELPEGEVRNFPKLSKPFSQQDLQLAIEGIVNGR